MRSLSMPCSRSSAGRFTSRSRAIPMSPAEASAKSRSGAWSSDRASRRGRRGPMPGRRAAERIRKAIALVNSVADDAGDEEITQTEIAEAIRDCLELSEVDDAPNVRKYLGEALDAVSDGMPADFVAMTLYAALGALQEGGQRNERAVRAAFRAVLYWPSH